MKRIAALLAALVLVLGLTACKSLEDLDFNKIMDQIFVNNDRPAKTIIQTAPSDSGDRDATGGDETPKAEEPVIPDHSDAPAPAEPDQPKPDVTADPEPAPPPSDPGTGDVTASHSDATFFGPGESFLFLPKGVTGVYACTYESEDPDVASVDQNTGRVTAVGPGTTTVTMHVEWNGQYDFDCIVRCNWKEEKSGQSGASSEKPASKPADPEPTLPPSGASSDDTGGITASHTDATFFNEGEHFRLVPKGVSGVYSVDYSSADPEVAMVDEISGVVTAVGPGTTTVTMHVECDEGQFDFDCVVRCKCD